jgi:hypothetical protein
MQARIYQPARNAMQSGWAATKTWVLRYKPDARQVPDPLMGWIGGASTQSQVILHFETREAAVAYAQAHGIAFELEQPQQRVVKPKAYADNFRYGRAENWTH